MIGLGDDLGDFQLKPVCETEALVSIHGAIGMVVFHDLAKAHVRCCHLGPRPRGNQNQLRLAPATRTRQ